MATFEEQVEALTGISIGGSSNPTQTELSSFLVDGVIDVVNRMIEINPEETSKFTKTTNDTGSVLKVGKILSVVREHDSTSVLRKCSQIDPGDRYDATDTESLKYRSSYSPGFYELNGSIYTVPAAGSGNNDIVVTQVHYDTGLVYGDTYNAGAIENFPKDYERLVALYASIQSLHSKMSGEIISIIAVVPDVPTISSQSVTITGTAPTYTTPSQTISGTAWATAYPDQYSDITIAWAAINTELDETQAICDSINTNVDSAVAQILESVTQVDADVDTALEAMATAAGRINTAVMLANGQYDNAVLESAQAELEADDGAIATALTAINTNVDLAISIIDTAPVPPDVPTISSQSVTITGTAPTYTPPAETISGTAWATAYPDENSAIDTALGAMTTELNKVDNIIDTAHTAVGRYYTDIADIDDTNQLWDNTNKRFLTISDAITQAQNLIDNSEPDAAYDAEANLADVDAAFDAMDAHLTDGEAILTNDPTSGAILTALDGIKDNVVLANSVIDVIPVPPDVPTLSTSSVTITGNAPSYPKPTIQGDSDELTDVTSGALGSAETDFDEWFHVVGQYIEDQEDAELAGSQLQKISTYISAFGQEMQNAVNVFNEANVEYQAKLQTDMQDARFDNEEEARKLQKYQAEISEYQAEIGAMTAQAQGYLNIAQGYTGEVQARISYATAYQQASAARGAEGGARINQLNATVSVAAQELQRANVAIAEINTIMASYRLDLEGVAPYLQTAQGYIGQASGYAQEVQALLSQTPAKVSEYSAKMQDALNTFNEKNAEYQAILQKDIQDAQLLDANEAKKLQKYSAEIAEYQAELGEMTQRAQGYLSIAQGYAAEVNAYQVSTQLFTTTAQNRVNAGNAFLAEANASAQELSAYGNEVASRMAQVGGYAQIATGYIAAAQGFATEIQTKINIAQGYSSEIQARLAPAAMKVSEFQATTQDALNTFNKENIEYQAKLQKDIQDAQLADANEARKLQKYSAEIAEYQAEVNSEIQEKTTKMQHYQLLYNQLKAEYDQAFMIAAPPQQQQAEA